MAVGKRVVVGAWILCLVAIGALAEDWPAFRHDRKRTSVTGETVRPPLERIWLLKTQSARLAPRFSGNLYADVTPEGNRTTLPITAVEDSLFYTSKSEGRLVCLDAASGRMRWQFVSGAAIQRAATVYERRVYVGSDDGWVYCLDSDSGKLVWKYQAVPADRWIFSYERPVSAWPVRTDVVVDPYKGSTTPTAYFGSGVFPHDGTFVHALNARTGECIWWNGAHCETRFQYSLSPHGHIWATDSHLYMPMDYKSYRWGSFNSYLRSNGRWNNQAWGTDDPEGPGMPRGDFAPLVGAKKDGIRYYGNSAVNESAKQHVRLWDAKTPGYNTDLGSIQGILPTVRGAPVQYDPDLCPVIYAGGIVYQVAFKPDAAKGVVGRVYARDAKDGKELWSADTDEWPNQVIAANGRVFVSTRSGTIYAYAPAGSRKHGRIEEKVEPSPEDAAASALAKAMVQQSGVKKGYALVLDCDSGGLAYELAKQTDLYVCAVFSDAEKARAAREAWVRAGVHVSRITAYHRRTGKGLPYPRFFADLITSETAADGGGLPAAPSEMALFLRPISGKALIGGKQTRAALEGWVAKVGKDELTGNGPEDWTIQGRDGSLWATWSRPALKEAGGWTHGSGDAGNTMCSQDSVLKPPLGAVWYGRPYSGRHGRGPAPSILVDGVLLHQFMGKSEAFDAYTGRKLWQSNLLTDTIAAPGSIFFRFLESIRRLDPQTGRTLGETRQPFPNGKWNAVAASADGEWLYGLAGGQKWSAIVAMQAKTGKVVWTLGGPNAKEQWHGWSAISDGRIYFLGGGAEGGMRAAAAADMRAWLAKLPGDEYKEFAASVEKHDIRVLTAVDGATGKVLYRRGVDISNAGGGWTRSVALGHSRRDQKRPVIRASIQAHGGAVVFGTAGAADKYWAVWPGGGYKGRALSVYDGATGKLLWYRFGNYRCLPVVTNDFVIAEPWAFHLRTGEPRTREHPITGLQAPWSFWRADKQCGVYNGSTHFIFGRSRGIGYHDLLTDQGLYTFMHSRASCWIDTSSGSGVMVKPPHAISCRCEVSMPFTVALGSVRTPLLASQIFSQSGPALPVKHLFLDFGATGDRRDPDGNLWMTPRSAGGLHLGCGAVLEWYKLKERPGLVNGNNVQRSAVFTPVENAAPRFVFASAALGLKTCKLPLTKPDAPARSFRVRLGFSALPGDKPGQRVFDVIVNGKTVVKDMDIVAEAGKADRALWKELTIGPVRALTLELKARTTEPPPEAMPLINAMVVLRTD